MNFRMADEDDLVTRRFSTEQFQVGERIARWREEFGRTVVKVDIEPESSDLPFKADAVLRSMPGLRMAMCSGSRSALNRTNALAGQDNGDAIGLIVNLGEPALASQKGRDLVLSMGDAVIVRPDEAGLLSGERHFNLLLPRSALAERTTDFDSRTMLTIPKDNEALKLLITYIGLIGAGTELRQPALRQAFVNHVHDLAALVFGAHPDVQQQGRRAAAAAKLASAVDHIGRSFTDPNLSVAAVARQMNISPRYLQELLERSGSPFTARVNELRLKRAFALLTRFPDQSVSEVAIKSGFSNVSHFNRLFRQRFGDTPSGVRGGM